MATTGAADGSFLLKDDGEKIVEGYTRFLPDFGSSDTVIALSLVVLGCVMVVALDLYGSRKERVQ